MVLGGHDLVAGWGIPFSITDGLSGEEAFKLF